MPMQRILAVDDSASIRKLIRIHLKGLGIVVDEAENGAEGLKLLAKGKYDLVITDLMMPVMDGIVMLRMKDAMHNKVPVIVLTAEVNAELNQAMTNPCVMDYLRKPLDPHALRVAITQILSLAADDVPPA
jgi:two-component system chemotaxis response regulator CheY